MKRVLIPIVCDGSGAFTSDMNACPSILGKLYAVEYLPGTILTGATITLTGEGALSRTLLVKASAGTSNVTFYPRELQNATADGAALTGTAGGDRTQPIVDGKLKLVVASGGAAGAGTLIAYVDDK